MECENSVSERCAIGAAKEVSKYKLDLVGVQEVRWERWH
jgi:hypothetical protein